MDTLTKCMDFLEKKMIEIIQFSTEPVIEENSIENEEVKNLENVQNSIFEKENARIFIDNKKMTSTGLSLKSIKENAQEILNNFIKKHEKLNG
jgi:hypothetical protein